MLYKLTSVFLLAAFFMVKNLTALQVAFSAAVEQSNPALSIAMNPQLFFPLFCLLLCLSTACLATECAFWLFRIAYLAFDFGIESGRRQYQKFSQTRASHLMPTAESGTPSVNERWAEQAYPLKRISIVAQCTRHGTNESLIEQLDVALKLLKEGFANGCEHDDDFGYIFKAEGDLRTSIFGEETSGRRHQ